MTVSYNGNKIIPAPLVEVAKRYVKQADGAPLGVSYTLTIKGTLLPFKGSPLSDKTWWTQSGYPPDETVDGSPGEDHFHLLRKQEALRQLFSDDGKSLEWQAAGGQPVVKCNPRIISLQFPEGQWAQRCEYIIEAETEVIYLNGGDTQREDASLTPNLREASEVWTFDQTEGKDGTLYNISHEARATAIRSYEADGGLLEDKQAWQHAKTWCLGKATGALDTALATEVVGQSLNARNYSKSVVVDKTAGGCTVTERWVGTNQEYSIDKSWEIDTNTSEGTYTVRYTGTVTGYGADVATRITSAKAGVPVETTARTETLTQLGAWVAPATLPTKAVNKSLGLNERDGTASFSYEWSTTDGGTATANIEYNSALRYAADTNEWQLSLTQDVQGLGTSSTEKLANARAAILSDASAKTLALQWVTADWPTGQAPNYLSDMSVSTNETKGQIVKSWTWTTRDVHNLSVRVTTSHPGAVLAIIPIPGRGAGPVIQDMSTVTEKRCVISLEGVNYTTEPGDLAIAYLTITGKKVRDERNWDPIRKTFSQTQEWVEMIG